MVIKNNHNENYLLKILIGCAVSALFIWFSLANINWADTLNTLKNIHPWSIVGIFSLFCLFFIIKAFRWSYILHPVSPKTPTQLFPVMMAGVMLNAAFSVLVGEIFRSIMLGKQFRISKSSILATIFVERLFDILALLLLLGIAILFSTLQYPYIRLLILLGLAVFVLIGVILIALWNARSLRFLEKYFNWLPDKVREIGIKRIKLAIEGLGSFTKPRLMLNISLLSIILWLVMGLANYLSIRSVGIHVPFAAAIFVMVINAFALVLPSSPGYLGIFEFGYIVGLEAFGISPSDAFAAAILYHMIYLLTVALIGIPSWSSIARKEYE